MERAAARVRAPRLSVLVPVFDPAPEQLAAAAYSVLDQPASVELVLVDAGCRTAPARRLLSELGRRPDVRLVPEHALDAPGIAGATNAGARAARGEVLVFLDHDDLLADGVLARIEKAFEQDERLDLLSTDEDQLTRDGEHVAPVFRAGPSPWMLLGFNAATHLVAIRAAFFEALGGLRPECDGAQDHDLLLRAWEHARRVAHLHRIGYHWRRAPGSVSESSTHKPWAFDAGLAAVRDALLRRGLPAAATGHTDVRGVYAWGPLGGDGERARPWRPAFVLPGTATARATWVEALASGGYGELLDEAARAGRWPVRVPSDGLLAIDCDGLVPDAEPLAALRAWTRLGVEGVARAPVHGGRRAHLGFTLTRDGWCEPILPGLRAGAAGPSLLSAAPREVATSGAGLLWVARVPDDLLAMLDDEPVTPADVLALGLLPATRGSATLFVPGEPPRGTGGTLRRARPVDLEASALWPPLAARLPESFWRGRVDRFCPRHELLVPLGLPEPHDDTDLSWVDARTPGADGVARRDADPSAEDSARYASPSSRTTV
ncbi:MAG: glycosyltransferase [Planctomycetes bacterium]|nr:glycosyltransferase [Planctomycetota bacterium]